MMSDRYAALRTALNKAIAELNYPHNSSSEFETATQELLRETRGLTDLIEILAEREADKARIAELENWVRGVEESMISASDRAESADKRVAELEARKLVPVMYKGMELLKKEGLELIRDGLVEATVLESMCMAGALLSATPAQPIKVPDEREAFNAWNNDIDCPLAGRDAKTAAWLGWSRRAAMLTAAPGKEG